MLVNVQLQNVFVKMDRGLGDTIERVTKDTGVKKVVETISKKMGKPCGCSERRDSLNRMFPYK